MIRRTCPARRVAVALISASVLVFSPAVEGYGAMGELDRGSGLLASGVAQCEVPPPCQVLPGKLQCVVSFPRLADFRAVVSCYQQRYISFTRFGPEFLGPLTGSRCRAGNSPSFHRCAHAKSEVQGVHTGRREHEG
jgi:hypothetical protein